MEIFTWSLVGLVTLAIVVLVVPGIRADGVGSFLLAWLVMRLLRFVMGFLPWGFASGPVMIVVGIILGALLLMMAGWIVPGFEIDGFVSALLGSITMTAIGWLLTSLLPELQAVVGNQPVQ